MDTKTQEPEVTKKKTIIPITLGIDDGNGYVKLAVFSYGNDYEIQPLSFKAGKKRCIPSIITIDKQTGEMFYGFDAEKALRKNIEKYHIIENIKTQLSCDNIVITKYNSETENFHDEVIKDNNGNTYNPEHMYAQWLKYIYSMAVNAWSSSYDIHGLRPIEQIIIGHPASGFFNIQREAREKAFDLSGIEIPFVRNMSEPEACALSYIYKNNKDLSKDMTLLMVDIGHGTTDIALIKVANKKISLIAGNSINYGGKYIEQKIAEYIIEEFLLNTGEEWTDSPKNKLLLDKEVKRVKHALSDNLVINFNLNMEGKETFHIEVSQETLLMELLRDWLKDYIPQLMRDLFELPAVKESNILQKDITQILFAGQCSNAQWLHHSILQKSDFTPETFANAKADEDIIKYGAAMGLGIAAYLLPHLETEIVINEKGEESEISILKGGNIDGFFTSSTGLATVAWQKKDDGNHHPYCSIHFKKGEKAKIDEQGIAWAQESVYGTTMNDNQRSVSLVAVQGDAKNNPENNKVLGMINVTDLPLKKAGEIRIKYQFGYHTLKGMSIIKINRLTGDNTASNDFYFNEMSQDQYIENLKPVKAQIA